MDASQLEHQVKRNYDLVMRKMAGAAAGHAVQLICVTKYASMPWIEALLSCGAVNIAENRLPDAVDRFADLRGRGYSFTAHLIGAQQSRKLKLIPGNFDWFQALDSLGAATRLDELMSESRRGLQVLLQVNIGKEPQKHGVEPEAAEETCARIMEDCPALNLRGIMAIPPWPDSYASGAEFEGGTRAYFRQMKGLFDKISSYYKDCGEFDTLSLGMSQDYVWAIEEGATMVRVGTALFEGLEG
jgi:pyridoxal phosphate enzyme (YggS family)